jgi:hypothetical protein
MSKAKPRAQSASIADNLVQIRFRRAEGEDKVLAVVQGIDGHIVTLGSLAEISLWLKFFNYRAVLGLNGLWARSGAAAQAHPQ